MDMTTWVTVGPILLGVGAMAGTLAGLLGVGGGIVIVPVLYWLTEAGLLDVAPDVAMHFAVATSLCTIIPTSISSALAHRRKGSIDMGLVRAWAPFLVLGAILGGGLAAQADARVLALVFGVIALIVALSMLNPKPVTLAEAPPSALWQRAAIAGPIGALSAMMGIGGGTLAVPVLTLLSCPVHKAVGTAAVFGLAISVLGSLGYATAGSAIPGLLPFSVGYINLPAAFAISIATVLFAPLGARIAHRLVAQRLRAAFALFLSISAMKMLWEALS